MNYLFDRITSDGIFYVNAPSSNLQIKPKSYTQWYFDVSIAKKIPQLIVKDTTKGEPTKIPLTLKNNESLVGKELDKILSTKPIDIAIVYDPYYHNVDKRIELKSNYQLDQEDFNISSDGTRLPFPLQKDILQPDKIRDKLTHDLSIINNMIMNGYYKDALHQVDNLEKEFAEDPVILGETRLLRKEIRAFASQESAKKEKKDRDEERKEVMKGVDIKELGKKLEEKLSPGGTPPKTPVKISRPTPPPPPYSNPTVIVKSEPSPFAPVAVPVKKSIQPNEKPITNIMGVPVKTDEPQSDEFFDMDESSTPVKKKEEEEKSEPEEKKSDPIFQEKFNDYMEFINKMKGNEFSDFTLDKVKNRSINSNYSKNTLLYIIEKDVPKSEIPKGDLSKLKKNKLIEIIYNGIIKKYYGPFFKSGDTGKKK